MFYHFDRFARLYLQSEVFSSLPDRLSREEQQDYEARIDEVSSLLSSFAFSNYLLVQVCWLICNPPYLERGDPVLMAPCVQQLWRVFCMLGEVVEEEAGVLEVNNFFSSLENRISDPGRMKFSKSNSLVSHHTRSTCRW